MQCRPGAGARFAGALLALTAGATWGADVAPAATFQAPVSAAVPAFTSGRPVSLEPAPPTPTAGADQAADAPDGIPWSTDPSDVDAGTSQTAVRPAPAEGPDTGPPPLEEGEASWYGRRFHGRRTASGERFDMAALTAAHPWLPFGTRVRIRHVETGAEVEVRINDRGPFRGARIIDLSRAAARALGLAEAGAGRVRIWPVGDDLLRPRISR